MVMIKMSDIATAANVSVKTVSRVLNGQPHVREEARDRVLYMADVLGYRKQAEREERPR